MSFDELQIQFTARVFYIICGHVKIPESASTYFLILKIFSNAILQMGVSGTDDKFPR